MIRARRRSLLLVLGPFVAFFATGYFSGFGAVTAEIYPTAIRATAQGFTYNIGRARSAPRRPISSARSPTRTASARRFDLLRRVHARRRLLDLDS